MINFCDNHCVKWTCRINCDKTSGEPIDETEIANVSEERVILSNIVYKAIPKEKVKGPECIHAKIYKAYTNPTACVLIIYENCTVYLKGREEKVGKLL